jgi:hypothetical protein
MGLLTHPRFWAVRLIAQNGSAGIWSMATDIRWIMALAME